MDSVYLVRSAEPASARIFLHEKEIASLRTEQNGNSELISSDGSRWTISPKVDGGIHPFSLLISGDDGSEILKVKYHLFNYRGSMYMIGNVPENKSRKEILVGPKYISRLINFPIVSTSDLDHETISQLRRYRGTQVGEISGIGRDGHVVRLEAELDDIGLAVATTSYLLYTTPHDRRLAQTAGAMQR